MAIRPANIKDLNKIMAVLDAAREIMRSDGNKGQWINGYPNESVILKDIKEKNGYVVEEDSRIIAYFAFIPSPEPTYAKIYNGSWLNDTLPYHVVHRIGSTPNSHRVFKTIMDWCFSHDPNIRIDTHRANRIMQHCITSYGFSYCGIIYLESGDDRLAYQKIL